MNRMLAYGPRPLLAIAAALSLSAPALAQDAEEGTVYDGDYLSIGAGGAYGPSYEGSDDYVVFPVGAAMGEFHGIGFRTQGPALYVDLAPDTDGSKVDMILGPTVRVNLNRVTRDGIKDDRVEALGDLKTGIEIGGELGFTVNRVLHAYDSVTLSMEARWDVNGASDGRILSPRVTYFTPLSPGIAASLSLSAENMDDDYANYYFGIAPGAPGPLPAYQADDGWKSASANLFLAYDLDGDLTNGGVSIFANGSYKRLLNDAKDSPITSIAGDADQWLGALGIGYTF